MYQALFEECYPSLRINIWCYPTSRVLTISCVQYFGEWFGLFLVISNYICRFIQALNIISLLYAIFILKLSTLKNELRKTNFSMVVWEGGL
jgi:hypothetical protein